MVGDEEVLAGMFSQLKDIEEPEVDDIKSAPSPVLMLRLKALDAQLGEMGELHSMRPSTQTARDLHSQRGALVIELKNRRAL